MADHDRDDSMEVHCGRCGTLLIVRLEDIKEKHTIDCEACEHTRPAENEVPVTRSSRVSASAQVDRGMVWSHWPRQRSRTTRGIR